MHILGIETSGRIGSLALQRDNEILAEKTLSTTGRRHAQTLILEVRDLLAEIGVPPKVVDVVAVSKGPGSFTGLRVGAAFAKTFCYATQARLVAVDTLQCVAEQVPDTIPVIHAIEDAQRGDVFACSFEFAGNGRAALGPTQIVSVEEFASGLPKGAAVVGPGLKKYADDLTDSRALSVFTDFVDAPPAAIVSSIGGRLAERDEYADPWEFEPFYLRKSAAEEKRDQQSLGTR